jgi:hypothetical protein
VSPSSTQISKAGRGKAVLKYKLGEGGGIKQEEGDLRKERRISPMWVILLSGIEFSISDVIRLHFS